VIAQVEDAEKERYVVLYIGSGLTAVPWNGESFAVGREVKAQPLPAPELDRQRLRALVWQVEDIERARERDRGRER
jgi:hypothetical protein